ncbi:MAG: hypothetical protein E7514_00440 [Ruminococcaceae bacterium]|nr:hypothetical protein [Oscillospiraceae bacterium]
MTEHRFEPGFIPKSQLVFWTVMRVVILGWGIYGLLHGSTVEFLEAIFAVIFTHLWDFFQISGGSTFITRVDYTTQTMLNLLIFIGVAVGSTLNNRTDFHHFDLITHFFAGFIASWIAYDLAVIVQGPKRRLSPAVAGMFAIFAACFITVGWEMYEFTMDRVYGLLLQNSMPMSDEGITDTMVDMIMSAAGGLVGLFAVAFYRNGIIGTHKEIYKEKMRRLEEDELLKEKLLREYRNKERK